MSNWTLAGATIVDGTGAEPFYGNIVIEGDRIASAGTSERRGTVIDATGLVAVPGFVDIHSHLDWIAPLPNGPSLLAPNVQQGITTSVAGNCGISPAPLGEFTNRDAIDRMLLANLVSSELGWNWRTLGEYLTELERRGLPLNLATFVGHSTLRATILGGAQRPATAAELEYMRRLLEEGLRDGAVGLSVGLEYFPGRYAGPSEVEELTRTAALHDGLVAVHTRGISELFDEAMDEALGFAQASRCRLQIAHVNPMGKANWDGIDRLFDKVDAAKGEGIDVAFDIVGYTAWTMTAIEALPHVVADLGPTRCSRWPRPQTDASTCADSSRTHGLPGRRGSRAGSPGTSCSRWVGTQSIWPTNRTASQATGARTSSISPTSDWRARGTSTSKSLTSSHGSARIINDGYGGNAADDGPLRRLVARPDAIPETDTVIIPSNGKLTVPLPMFWGTMPRFLGRFSRDLELVPMPQAVQRITQLPARRARLIGRGELTPNAYADVVLLDWNSVNDAGTFLDPEPAAGVEWVFVNGDPVVRERLYDPGSLPGRAIRARQTAD